MPKSAEFPTKAHTELWLDYAESVENGLSPCHWPASLPAIASLSPVFCPFTYPAALSSPLAGASRFPAARMEPGGYRGGRGWWRPGIWGAAFLYAMTKKPKSHGQKMMGGGVPIIEYPGDVATNNRDWDYQPTTVAGCLLQHPKIGGWRVSDFPGLKGLDGGMGLECSSGGIIAGLGMGRHCVDGVVGVIGWGKWTLDW